MSLLSMYSIRVSAQNIVSYRKQIGPLLKANCFGCHNSSTPQSGFSVSNYAAVVAGGKHGKAVVPGNGKESLLLKYLDGRNQPRMPIGGTLKPAEIAKVQAWIDAGAKLDGEPDSVAATPIRLKVPLLPQIACIAWSKNGGSVLAGTFRDVVVFDATTGEKIRVLGGHADVVRSLAFSPDGSVLAAAGGLSGQSGEVILWDWKSGKIIRTLQGHTDAIYGVAWRPDGKEIVTCSYDKTVQQWDPETGKSRGSVTEHADAVYGIGYSPDGKYLATVSADRSLRIWNPLTCKRIYTLSGHTELVSALSFHPIAAQIVTAGADKSAKIWNLKADGGDAAKTIATQPEAITDVRYSPDGSKIVTSAYDGTVRIWDINSGAEIRKIAASKDAILAISYRPDGKLLAAGGYDGSLTLFLVEDGTKFKTLIEAPMPPKRTDKR